MNRETHKRSEVISAALQVFLAYGIRRASMQDVADAASISRASLYLTFASKDELFEAVISSLQMQVSAEIVAETEKLNTAQAKIEKACEIWGAKGYEFIKLYPNSMDMFDPERPAVRAAYAEFNEFLASLFETGGSSAGTTLTAEEKARLMISAMRGFKETADDIQDLSRLVRMQVSLLSRPD